MAEILQPDVPPPTNKGWWRTKFRNLLLRTGLSNQGTGPFFPDSPSRQQKRREAFNQNYIRITNTYGDNMTRRQRRRLAWDTWRDSDGA